MKTKFAVMKMQKGIVGYRLVVTCIACKAAFYCTNNLASKIGRDIKSLHKMEKRQNDMGYGTHSEILSMNA